MKMMQWLMMALLAGNFALGCESKENTTAEAAEATTEEAEGEAKKEEEQKVELTFAFQPQENPDGLLPDANKLAEFISEKTGYEVKVFVPTSYAAVVEALRAGNADVAYFSGWPYAKAHEMADVSLLLVEERNGNPFYHSQWYVPKDSDVKTLADLSGKKVAFTSPTSTSGYLFPYAKLVEEGVLKQGQDPKEVFAEVLFAGGYEAALKSVANGKVDAAAASDYAFELYLSEEERERVRVLTKQGPVPTHGFAIRSQVPEDVREKVKAALLALNEPENKELLKSVYGAEKLVERTHEEHIASLEKARELTSADYPLEPKK